MGGVDLQNMGHPDLAKRLHSDNALSGIGAILAFDLLLNNNDRLPCTAWSATGNPANLFFLKTGLPVAIDTVCFALDPVKLPLKVKQHCAKVAAIVQQVREFVRAYESNEP